MDSARPKLFPVSIVESICVLRRPLAPVACAFLSFHVTPQHAAPRRASKGTSCSGRNPRDCPVEMRPSIRAQILVVNGFAGPRLMARSSRRASAACRRGDNGCQLSLENGAGVRDVGILRIYLATKSLFQTFCCPFGSHMILAEGFKSGPETNTSVLS
jgi:hypothetical protein